MRFVAIAGTVIATLISGERDGGRLQDRFT